MDEKSKIKGFVSLQKSMEDAGVTDPDVACSAAFIMDNIFLGYPTEDLVTSYPLSEAFAYLVSSGLVTIGHRLTDAGLRAYKGQNGKIYPIQ